MDSSDRVRQLIAGYSLQPDIFDEMLAPDGSVRPQWLPTLDYFANMAADERKSAMTQLNRILRENRVTFIAQDDADSTRRPWQVDLFPLIVSPSEWRQLAYGLTQRARLLNETLSDLYGEQRALKEGKLAPGVVFGSRQFLPPCARVSVKNGLHLHFMAFDVARSPDGRWWVLSDRTEAPSGAGYTLENRIVTSRSLPQLFAQQNVERHAGFFRAFNEYFMGLAERDEPLAVFLSRGPAKRTYFEHAYLARYLGYTIVEGSDLAVRNHRLYLKTIEGLRPVDLVMRTVRSEMCDPLELRTDSMIGVPGLLQAVRAGHAILGNSLGSGLVESDAFLSFLPTLSRFYLGEDLAIPSVATWWCGQPAERDYVLANLDSLTVRRISSTRSLLTSGQDGRVRNQAAAEREALIEQIRADGQDFVGQENVALSTAPMWTPDGRLEAAPVVLRMFVAATENGYRVMPGALTRVSVSSDPHNAWLAASDISKDTWILSDQPVQQFSMLAHRLEATWLRRSSRSLPSRTADNLFWLGRYTERTEAAVRLLRSLVLRLRGETGSSRHLVSPERLISLLVLRKHISSRRGKRAVQEGRDAVERELWSVLFDPESPDGLATLIGNVQRNADVVRERLSSDAFRILMTLTDLPRVTAHGVNQEVEDALRLLDNLIQQLAAFTGMVSENMTRSDGWRFLDMGRRIERVRAIVQLTRQLTVRGDPEKDGSLELLLELADSTMTYLGRYHSTPQLARVLDLVLADELNPRSIIFQVLSIEDHLHVLKRSPHGGLLSPEQRITTQLSSELRLGDVFEMGDTKSRFGTRIQLDRLLRRLAERVDELSDLVSHFFFSHSIPRRVSANERRREPR